MDPQAARLGRQKLKRPITSPLSVFLHTTSIFSTRSARHPTDSLINSTKKRTMRLGPLQGNPKNPLSPLALPSGLTPPSCSLVATRTGP